MAGRPQRKAQVSAQQRAFGMGVMPQGQRSLAVGMPAPVGGINTVSPAMNMAPTDCLQLFNLIPFQYGTRIRSGWMEHVTNVGPGTSHPGLYPDGDPVGSWPGAACPGVRTLISFSGSNSKGLTDRLFACTEEGIWDVSKAGTAPTLVFGSADGWVSDLNSGKGVGTAFTNVAGEHFYAYTDGTNGYLLYRESTDDWVQIVEGEGTDGLSIKGADPRKFRFVMAWKNRLWFASDGSATATYLPVNQFAGVVDNLDVTAGGTINFGARFRYGGALVGLWNWTVDGGLGIDDHLVGISTAGDVVVYAGTDPALPGAFGLKGVWWVGPVPPGRRIASAFGGDLFILSIVGCVALSKLVSGYMIRDPNLYATEKIWNLFNKLMSERGAIEGWEVNIHPTDNLLMIMVPATPAKVQEQLAMSMASKGWARLIGIPMSTMETWRGKLYFGTFDGRVCINTGYVDGLTLDGSDMAMIDFGMLSSFQSLGSSNKKRVHMIRPLFMTDGTPPGYEVEARWDFDLSGVNVSPVAPELLTDVWTATEWGAAEWADGVDKAGRYGGATGLGTYAAVVLRGSARNEVTLVGFDVVIESGGIL